MKQDQVTAPLPDGINQSGVRNHNERLVLSTIRRHGRLASSEVARKTNLSAQTASVITRALEADGFLIRGNPVRGKVGKPLVPMQLNPDGVLSYGLKIGRRSARLMLVDFTGEVRAERAVTFPYPTPSGIVSFLAENLGAMADAASNQKRIAGIGIASPFELWKWLDTVDAPKHEMMAWKGFSLEAALGRITDLDVFVGNDATLGCAAEHMFGAGRALTDFAYFYIGSFVGGGIILGNAVHGGRTGNAGAFGSMPVRNPSGPDHQLINNASLYTLERDLQEAGLSTDTLFDPKADWRHFEDLARAWIARSAPHLATASVAACSVLEFQAILIDGGVPDWVRRELVRQVSDHIDRIDTQGISRPDVLPGSLGRSAGGKGAAYQPIISKYLLGTTPTRRYMTADA